MTVPKWFVTMVDSTVHKGIKSHRHINVSFNELNQVASITWTKKSQVTLIRSLQKHDLCKKESSDRRSFSCLGTVRYSQTDFWHSSVKNSHSFCTRNLSTFCGFITTKIQQTETVMKKERWISTMSMSPSCLAERLFPLFNIEYI